jgi:hypothetical protein
MCLENPEYKMINSRKNLQNPPKFENNHSVLDDVFTRPNALWTS